MARNFSWPHTFWDYHLAVLESTGPNVFAAPRGTILITRSFLGLCANEDELAADLAHKVAHRDGVSSFAIQPLSPEDSAKLSRLVRNWDDFQDWFILKETNNAEQLITIELDVNSLASGTTSFGRDLEYKDDTCEQLKKI